MAESLDYHWSCGTNSCQTCREKDHFEAMIHQPKRDMVDNIKKLSREHDEYMFYLWFDLEDMEKGHRPHMKATDDCQICRAFISRKYEELRGKYVKQSSL